MVRKYKPVRPKARPEARRVHAARLRSEGLSLRQIGQRQGVSKDTVMRDLRKWDDEHANVVRLPDQLPRGQQGETAGQVLELRPPC